MTAVKSKNRSVNHAGLPDELLFEWYRANRGVADGERFRVEIQPGSDLRSFKGK